MSDQITAKPPPAKPAASAGTIQLETARFMTSAADVETPCLDIQAPSAHSKQLGNARTILLVIGILSLLVNLGLCFMVRDQVMTELRQQGVRNLPPGALNTMLLDAYVMHGVNVLVSAVFIVLGLLVKSYPVPSTVIGLVLYLLDFVLAVFLDPEHLRYGMYMKIFITGALIKACSAAFAYERERAARGVEA